MAKRRILGLATLAGLGYVGWNALKGDEQTPKTTNALGFQSTEQQNDTVELIKQVVKTDKELQRLLKGNDGIGAKGEKGKGVYVFESEGELQAELMKPIYEVGELFLDTSSGIIWQKATMELGGVNDVWRFSRGNIKGAKGDAGDLRVNYLNSLFKDSEASSRTKAGYVDQSYFQIDTVNTQDGLPVLSVVATTSQLSVYSPVFVPINPKRLYKATYKAKSSVSGKIVDVRLAFYKSDLTPTPKTTGDTTAAYNNITVTTSFVEKTSYFGGIGNLNSSFGTDTVFAKLKLIAGDNSISYFSGISVCLVDLGEPVPYTLPYLPTGQMVSDPTDPSQLGRYDGTEVHWFTPLV